MSKLFALPICVYNYNNKLKYYANSVCSITVTDAVQHLQQHTVTDCFVQLKQDFVFQCKKKVIGLD